MPPPPLNTFIRQNHNSSTTRRDLKAFGQSAFSYRATHAWNTSLTGV